MESSRPKEKRKTKEHITPGNGNRHEKNEQELDRTRKGGPGQSGLENADTDKLNEFKIALNNRFQASQDILKEEENTMKNNWKGIKEKLTSTTQEVLCRKEHHHLYRNPGQDSRKKEQEDSN
ncbi:unnamed protein product [Schistosoma margrebowiei]|uniref:Uncharacterized protein n=1 Tax=Schistosoma margrebowiei TaxID=48269 RepID=A0A183LQ65_9TREM|nr:unnamed protein product [Schistosoma margrebowiei]